MTQFLNAFTALIRGNTGNFNKKYGITKKRKNRRQRKNTRKNRRHQ